MKPLLVLCVMCCVVISTAYAHTPFDSDAPWFFERVVHIQNGDTTQAGIIWDGTTIVTSSHGILSDVIHVTDVYGNKIQATLLEADVYSDVAVIEAHTGMSAVEPLYAAPGDMIYAVGHPKERPYVVTMGIISSIHHGMPASIIHDAAVSTGSSGGPVFGVNNGGLAGMTVARDELAFAIPYDIIDVVVQSVREEGTYAPGCVGIMLDDHTVRTTHEGVTGIYPGDVILSIDGREPFELQYERSAGEYVTVVLEDRTIQQRLGHMEEWFGVHRCVMYGLDGLDISNVQAYHVQDRLYISGFLHNLGDVYLSPLLIQEISYGTTHITQNQTGYMTFVHDDIVYSDTGVTTFHFEDHIVERGGVASGIGPMETVYFEVVITGIHDKPHTIQIGMSGTDGITTFTAGTVIVPSS